MIDFVLPSLGADMDEAMLVAWLVEPGDTVEYGQVIAEVETDKGVIEVECWQDGVIEEMLREPGTERLPVGTPLARIRPAGEAAEANAPAGAPATVTSAVAASPPPRVGREPPPPVRHLAHALGVHLDEVKGTGSDGVITREDIRRRASDDEHERAIERRVGGRPKASPLARRLAAETDVDLSSLVSARGDGLITSADVAAGGSLREGEHTPSEPAPAQAGPHEKTTAVDRATAMRNAIARSMSRSKREIPHYYLADTVDLKRCLGWLETENEERPITDRILPAALLLKATALAIRDVPELNGFWVEGGFSVADSVHLGVAVSLREGGLVAPAIHHADTLTLDEMMASLRDLVARARSWRLRGSEMSDPTVTVTNLGDRGVDIAFPVIIPPQVAMVGFGKIREAVVVGDDGSPAVHPIVDATLAADHRASDGHRGGLFLSALERLLQEPESL